MPKRKQLRLVADAYNKNSAILPSIFKEDPNSHLVQSPPFSRQSPKKPSDLIRSKYLRNLEKAAEPTFEQIIRA
jgi:hypothetical protein